MAPSPVLDRFVRLLCDRHGLSTSTASTIVYRAARRKGVTMHDLAVFVMHQVPLPTVVVLTDGDVARSGAALDTT